MQSTTQKQHTTQGITSIKCLYQRHDIWIVFFLLQAGSLHNFAVDIMTKQPQSFAGLYKRGRPFWTEFRNNNLTIFSYIKTHTHTPKWHVFLWRFRQRKASRLRVGWLGSVDAVLGDVRIVDVVVRDVVVGSPATKPEGQGQPGARRDPMQYRRLHRDHTLHSRVTVSNYTWR